MFGMTKADAIRYYGSQKALAVALKCEQPAVAQWGEYPPALRQIQLEKLTRGRLKAEPSAWVPTKASA